MRNGEVNRNLLVGLLALQNGLVDQSHLVAAFHDWVRDKNRSLADYLIERGQLEPDCKSTLDALAELYEKDISRKVEREVVATLGRNDRVRAELERSQDPDARSLLSFFTTLPLTAENQGLGSTIDASEETSSYKPDGAARPAGDSVFCGFTPKEHWARSTSPATRS